MAAQPSVFTDEISEDWEEAVRTAAEAGLRHVDVRNTWGRSCAELTRPDWERMAEVLRRYDVRMGAIQSPFGKCELAEDEYQRHLAFLPNLIEQAHFVGTDVIRVFPFWQKAQTAVRLRPGLAPALPEIADKLRRAARMAEQEGVFLALEPEPATYSGTPTETRMIVDAVGSPALRICWDVNNGWYADEPIFPDAYDRVRGLVVNVHVKDQADPPGQERGRRLPCLLG